MSSMTENNQTSMCEKKEELRTEYELLLDSYQRSVGRMTGLQRRFPVPEDPEVTERIQDLEKKRHNKHLKLLEAGKKINKDESDVLIDIIRMNRTLEEYGLPEFSILTEEDIIETEDWHNPYYFNVDTEERMPHEKDSIKSHRNEGKSAFPANKFMLVYSIMPVTDWGETVTEPVDYKIKLYRAQKLAEFIGGEMFERKDTGYHEATAKILGVIFSKKDFGKIMQTIRDNPEQFRLKEDFYNEEEISYLEEKRERQFKKSPAYRQQIEFERQNPFLGDKNFEVPKTRHPNRNRQK